MRCNIQHQEKNKPDEVGVEFTYVILRNKNHKLNAKKKLERHHIVDITKLFHIDHHQNGKTLTSGQIYNQIDEIIHCRESFPWKKTIFCCNL